MLQFASFDTLFWKVPSLIPKIRISQPQLLKRHLPIFHIEVCWKFQEIWPTGSTENNPPQKKTEYLFLLENATKPWSGVFFGIRSHSIFDRIYDTYPSQGPPEISLISHQGATFKPQHSSHWLHHNSWQSSYHGFLTAKRKVQKNMNNPKSEVKYARKLGSLRHV